jgi:hypothetical protein
LHLAGEEEEEEEEGAGRECCDLPAALIERGLIHGSVDRIIETRDACKNRGRAERIDGIEASRLRRLYDA